MKDQKWRTIFPVIHLFILSQKFEKALMMAAKIANNIGCFISHKEKKESKTLFLSFPKYLDHFYSDCIFFPPFSRCWHGKIDHAFFQGLAFSF